MKQLSFFTKKQIDQGTKIDISTVDQSSNCLKCGMYRTSKSPKMTYTGSGRLNCLEIAEASGETEDIKGEQLVGPVGKFFKNKLRHHNLLLDRDFYKLNAIGCRPQKGGANRTPTNQEIAYCRPSVMKTIKKLKPKFIWLMGGAAIESFYGDKPFDADDLKISKWRGQCIPDQETGAYILPLYHPSFPRRDERDLNLQACYDRDLKNAINCFNLKPFEKINYESKIETVYYYHDVKTILERALSEAKTLFFDYETNCLKPQEKGSRIASISMCWNYDKAYSFPYDFVNHFTSKEKEMLAKLWCRIQSNKNIIKEAQNLKFEHNWTTLKFGVEPQNWGWDTMIASHTLDNRRGITGLKLQTYLCLGVLPYDKDIKPYLKSKGRNKINNVMNAPLEDLLHYGGMDSLCGKYVKKEQIKRFKKIGGNLMNAYKFFHEGSLSMAFIERSGIPIDEDYYIKEDYKLDKSIAKKEKKILESSAAKNFEKQIGRTLKIKKDISDNDLRILFYDVLNKKKSKFTASGLASIDEETLHGFKDPLANIILERRKQFKIRNTYIHQFLRECIDSKLYPFFGLNIAISYRGTSQGPNFQNIPKRDETAKRVTRSGIIASKGNQIGDVDFGGIEVCTGCCYHKDPAMIKYITNPKSDMHRDSACDIWMLPPSEVAKMIRFYAKNMWVFAEFYGSYYANCAKNLWDVVVKELNLKTNDGTPIREHLRQKGITKYHTFEEHCKDVEKKFWHRFNGYKIWKNRINKIYREQGFIETFFGFRFTGLISFNEASNYPIQSTAFHILLWTLNRVIERAREEKWKSKILGHIHDQLVFNFHPKEVKYIFKTVNQIGTQEIRKVFNWINIPLTLEASLAPIGKSWYDTKEIPIL